MRGKLTADVKQPGRRFGKIDLDRVGFFDDPSPAPFDKYRGAEVEFREGIGKGRQILGGPSGRLFEKKFERIFDGEALSDPWRFIAKEQVQRGKAKVSGHFLPSSPSKKHSTPGDWYGCFDKVFYLTPALKAEAKRKRVERELPNMKIKPGPLGGPGYVNICLNPYPAYSHEPYGPIKKRKTEIPPAGRFLTASAPLDYFLPNPYEDKDPRPTYVRPVETIPKMIGPGRFYTPFPKYPGGNHDGCFNKFPEHISDPYIKMEPKYESQLKWTAGGPPRRTKYTNSVIEQITRISCNANNYMEYRERVYPLHN